MNGEVDWCQTCGCSMELEQRHTAENKISGRKDSLIIIERICVESALTLL